MQRAVAASLLFSGILASIVSTSLVSRAQESASQQGATRSVFYNNSPTTADEDLQLLKKDVRSQKKQIVAANMALTEDEALKFWPVYDRYAADIAKIYDTKLALIQEYLDNYQDMSGDQAESYLRRRAAVEQDVMQLRIKYVPEFRKVLTGRETTLFFQIDWRLDLLINLQLAQAPMIEP